MNVLITGATGLIGSSIVEVLTSKRNGNVKLFGLASREVSKLSGTDEFFRVDITNPENFSVLDSIRQLDVVIHSAGLAHQFKKIKSESFFKVNVEGTKNVLEFALRKSVKHFIHISSVSVYGVGGKAGERKTKIEEEQSCFPESAYALSKFKAEETAIDFCRRNNIALTVLRMATVIGEGDRGNVKRLIEAIDQRKFIMVGTGDNYKTLIYKKDAAKVCRVILEKKDLSKRETEIFNIAAEPIRMKYIIETVRTTLGKKKSVIFVPLILARLPLKILARLIPLSGIGSLSETLEKWTSDEMFANDKIKQKYSFAPETSVLEAIERETDYYLKSQKC